jgi:tellurium resistance protein TerD
MSLSLTKGSNLSLSKAAPGLNNVLIGLGWDARSTDGSAFDLDASAVLVGANGKVRTDKDLIFYGNKSEENGSVIYNGDNLTGEGDGDDETISVVLDKVAADVERIIVTATIYEGTERGQSFGQVRNAYVRIVNADNNEEVARYDLSEEAGAETGLLFAEVYRNNGEWKFKAVGQGYATGLAGIVNDFGISAS